VVTMTTALARPARVVSVRPVCGATDQLRLAALQRGRRVAADARHRVIAHRERARGPCSLAFTRLERLRRRTAVMTTGALRPRLSTSASECSERKREHADEAGERGDRVRHGVGSFPGCAPQRGARPHPSRRPSHEPRSMDWSRGSQGGRDVTERRAFGRVDGRARCCRAAPRSSRGRRIAPTKQKRRFSSPRTADFILLGICAKGGT
jgi:hypothetical protein